MHRSVVLLLVALSVASSFTAPTPVNACSRGAQLSMQPPNNKVDENKPPDTPLDSLPKFLAMGMIALSTAFGPMQFLDGNHNFVHPTVQVANAVESRVIGELKGSGLVFKDTLVIESFEDPKVKGVTLYVSNFQRPLNERLQKDFFSDPSSAGVGCAKTGPIQIADNIAMGKDGEEVFKESKSLLFKSLRVQRIYDVSKQTVVYVSFNTRLDKGDDTNNSRFKSSLCAVNLGEPSAVSMAAEATTGAAAK